MLTITNPKTFDWENMPLADCCEGNAMDTHFTYKLYELLEEKLREEKVWKFLENVVMPSMEIFAVMEYTGIHVDRSRLGDVGHFLMKRNMDLEEELRSADCVNDTDNLSSNNDLQKIFYTEEGGLELYPPDRTAKGAPSCSADTFKIIQEQISEELERRAK
jgi:DNA polymerase I